MEQTFAEMNKARRDNADPTEWPIWQIEQFLHRVVEHIQDGSNWLRCNRPYTFAEGGEEDGRWLAEDMIGSLLLERPWLQKEGAK